ncbi:MAG: hypothetical protein HYS21_11660 [Deltaproteobacteria bacterium]|nr:hypothetical protein [Deltaproteobacteria bacterium]
MKKNILIALLLTFIFSVQHAFAEETFKKAGDFKVRLPDGLYLYQPKIKEEVFSPLFIVEKGSLIDPYALAVRIGKEKFVRNYVDGRRFHVYIESVPVGTLTDVKFEFESGCYSDVFLPDLRGKGNFKGKPLKTFYSNKSLYASDEYDRSYGSLKVIAAPVELTSEKTLNNFKVTEKDKTMAVEAVIKRFVPEAFERIRKSIETRHEEKQVIIGQRGELQFLKSFRVDGEKKGLIGSYMFRVSFRDAAKQESMIAGDSSEILFSMFENKIELVAFADGYEPAYSLGGIIDIYGIGIPELVLQGSVTSGEDEDPDDGRQITISQHVAAGWRTIYRSEKICGTIY